MRPEFFPDDYIAPGEFRFCAAGWHLGMGPGQCVICSRGPGRWRAVRREKLICEIRELLAETRKAAGVPQLYWMKA